MAPTFDGVRPTIRLNRLEIGAVFKSLSGEQQLYAHCMARAAWSGTRIILRQVSPESVLIYDYIIKLYRSCSGDWAYLAAQTDVQMIVLRKFLEFAAKFLANIGNYYGKGDQKFVPEVSNEDLNKISSASHACTLLYEKIAEPMTAPQPSSLGYPGEVAHSSYYLGDSRMLPDEIAKVSGLLEKYQIHQENTRIEKLISGDHNVYRVCQASTEVNGCREFEFPGSKDVVNLVRGDHCQELKKICACLDEALKHTANSRQKEILQKYQESFKSGDIEPYKESQRTWVKDVKPIIETVLGFVEPYRDPFGVRAEFEGLVAVVDIEKTKTLTKLVKDSAKYIRTLPWAEGATENDRKGPFETGLFESPDFTSLQALAYCSSIIFPGINLPNYNDIRQNIGFKSVMITNTFASTPPERYFQDSCLDSSEIELYLKHKPHAYYLWVVFHELFGHGTGKMLVQTGPESFNFNIQNPPLNPLTGKPISSWYHVGETWTGLFGDIATSVDECRAECVGAYLMSDKDLLRIFDFSDSSEITSDDLEYNMYLQLGIAGLRALENFNVENHKWGQAHSRAHFAMFQCLLAAGDNFLVIGYNPTAEQQLVVRVQRTKISTHGRPAIRDLLLKLHIYRCTADVKACRAFYEGLTMPNERFLEWRKIMLANQEPKQIYVQANTFLEDGKVVLREYDATVEGMIQSWAERDV